MTRTDIHRPSSPDFDPQAYTDHGYFDLAMPAYLYEQDFYGRWTSTPNPAYKHWQDTLESLAKAGVIAAEHQRVRTCGHCGAHIRYAALLVRGAEWIYVGEDCLDNRFPLSADEFQKLRKAAKLNAERETRATVRTQRVEKLTAAHPELAPLFDAEWLKAAGNAFLSDIARKAGEWDLSPRQIQAAGESIARIEARKAERQAEAETLNPVPEGRMQITGTVVKCWWKGDGYYGGAYKMIVLDDRGFKIYGSSPEGRDCASGQRITFTATVKPAPNDPLFGFYKNPRGCKVDGVDGETVPPPAIRLVIPGTEAVA